MNSTPQDPVATRWLWRIIAAGVVLVPLFVSPAGKDSFRLPKELLFRAEAILIVTVIATLLIFKKLQWAFDWKQPPIIIGAATIAWTLISAATATNRLLSIEAFFWITGWTVIFTATFALGRFQSAGAVYLPIVPAAINGAVVLLQESGIWNPFYPRSSLEHVYHSGLIGNPNDVGTFLVVPTVAAFALIFVQRSRRLWHIGLSAFLLLACLANHTLSALIAISVGLLAVVFVAARKWVAVAFAVTVIMGTALVAGYPPLRFRFALGMRFARQGYYDSFLSGRTLPYLAAIEMFTSHPLTGVGPGCFKWEYFPYKLRVTEEHRNLTLSGTTVNYGAVHNDHLQILAETGVPGYALFLGALIAIVSISFRTSLERVEPEKRDHHPFFKSEFARVASFPIAAAVGIVALGQFPLELAASTAVIIYLLALCLAWGMSHTRPNVTADQSHNLQRQDSRPGGRRRNRRS